jgi:thymidylate synthase (FAD)
MDQGVARELARIALPLSLYTEWYWKIDLHNLFHFLRLRLDPHAQYEIRAYAEVMGKLAKEVVPLAWEAFEDYILQAVSFTAPELRALATSLGNLSENSVAESGLSARERAELIIKLDEIKAIISKQSRQS